MQIIPDSVQKLIDAFAGLPGVGPRTAERYTFYLLRGNTDLTNQLGEALNSLSLDLQACSICFNLSQSAKCVVCSATGRQSTTIAVVEEPLDVVALEKTGQFQGLYHVLGGVISPIDGIGPAQLQIASLIDRVKSSGIDEIILATNPTTEGETTAMYLRKQLDPLSVKVTRLARGLPVGGALEYADQVTLGRALQGRQAF